MQRKTFFKVSLLAGALVLAQGAWALGLGGMKVQSTLGHPLRAEIELLGTPDEFADLSATIATPSDYQTRDLTYLGAFSGATITVEPRPDGTAVLSVKTLQSINEPYLDLLVRVVWSSGQALREYTLLLDPPSKPGQKVVAPPPPPVLPSAETEQGPSISPPAEPTTETVMPEKTRVTPTIEDPYRDDTYRDSSYIVQQGDTLGAIAAMYKPGDITTQQALMAFYEANRAAFIRGNINLVKKGAVLVVPSSDEMRAVSREEARQTVRIQTEEWRNYIKAISADVQSTPEEAAPDSAGTVAPQTSTPTTQTGGTVTLKSEDPGTKTGDQIVALQNELDEKKREIERLNKLAVEAEQLAALQKQAAAVKPSEPAPAITPSQPETQAPPVVEPPVVVPPPPAPPVVTPPPPPPKPVVAQAPPPPPQPSIWARIFSSSFFMIAGLVLIVAFLFAYVMYRRKRREEDSDSSLFTQATSSMTASSTSLSTRSIAPAASPRERGAMSAQSSNSILSEFSREGLGNIETGEVDPLAEADVYLAYGRAQQAEEILHDALKKDSQRQDVHLKLLEVLADQKKTAEFEKIAQRLQALSSGQGEYWQRAKVLGQRLLPGNPRFVEGGFAPQPQVAATPRAKPAADPRGFAPMETPSVAQSIAQAAGRAVERREQTRKEEEGDSILNAGSSLSEMSEAHFSLEPLGTPQDDLGVDIDLEELSRFRNFGKTEESVAIDTSGHDLTKTQPATRSSNDLADLDLSFEASLAKKPEAFSEMTSETEGGWNDVATKLDLARAYQATGDAEACREILQEVLKEGDDQQKADAKAILQSLQGA